MRARASVRRAVRGAASLLPAPAGPRAARQTSGRGRTQAFGAKHYAAVGTWLHRSLIILTLACAPIVTLWAFTERLLLLAGQDPQVAAMTGAFILCAGALFAVWLCWEDCITLYACSRWMPVYQGGQDSGAIGKQPPPARRKAGGVGHWHAWRARV